MVPFQADAIEKYFKEEVGEDLPNEMWEQLMTLKNNIKKSQIILLYQSRKIMLQDKKNVKTAQIYRKVLNEYNL